MASKADVPDAWDDDFEDRADKSPQTAEQILESMPAMSKAERRAKQAELNRRLWEEAESPRASFYVAVRDAVPLQSSPKPSVTVLSRKPAPAVVARRDPVSGLERLTVQSDDEDDGAAAPQASLEERRARAAREREEKQRKYEEARERLFGAPSAAADVKGAAPARADRKGRGRGSRPGSAAGRGRFEGTHSPRPDASRHGSSGGHKEEEAVVRQPRGPDGTGRRGAGFGARGGKRP